MGHARNSWKGDPIFEAWCVRAHDDFPRGERQYPPDPQLTGVLRACPGPLGACWNSTASSLWASCGDEGVGLLLPEPTEPREAGEAQLAAFSMLFPVGRPSLACGAEAQGREDPRQRPTTCTTASPILGQGQPSGVLQEEGQTKGTLARTRGKAVSLNQYGGIRGSLLCSAQHRARKHPPGVQAGHALLLEGQQVPQSSSSPSGSSWVIAQPVGGSPGATLFLWSRPIQATTPTQSQGSCLPTADLPLEGFPHSLPWGKPRDSRVPPPPRVTNLRNITVLEAGPGLAS